MPIKVYVEWLNGDKAERLYEQRRAKAIAKERELVPDRPESEIVSPRDQDSWWDWVEMDECMETRAFPSLPLAKGWARQNYRLDYFEKPRINQNEWGDDQSEWEAETTLTLEYEGNGEWLNIHTGQTEKDKAKK